VIAHTKVDPNGYQTGNPMDTNIGNHASDVGINVGTNGYQSDGSAVHVMLALRRCSRPIVVTDEELNGTDMVGELLGKGQRVADQP
jgi:hypothetical protein